MPTQRNYHPAKPVAYWAKSGARTRGMLKKHIEKYAHRATHRIPNPDIKYAYVSGTFGRTKGYHSATRYGRVFKAKHLIPARLVDEDEEQFKDRKKSPGFYVKYPVLLGVKLYLEV